MVCKVQGTTDIAGYHAHVYYDAYSKSSASILRKEIEKRFEIEMGRWHDRPVGPHPMWSYQVAFEPSIFGEFVPWLALNRGDLIIFVHPQTGKVIRDHTKNAIWLGQSLALNLAPLERAEASQSTTSAPG